MNPSATPDMDDVLEAFATEPSTDGATLARYIRLYPQYALDLADFAHELRLTVETEDGTAVPDEVWQEESWRRFQDADAAGSSGSPTPIADPFAGLSSKRLADIRRELEIPSAVLSGFRDRLVLAASVPRGFAGRLAVALDTTIDHLETFLALPPRLNMAASHKSDVAPAAGSAKITFALLLEQAMVDPERRRDLLDQRD